MSTDKPVTWTQGTVIVGACFGLCCTGFFMLHAMVVNDKAFAASELKDAIRERNHQFDRMTDALESFKKDNEAQHREILDRLSKWRVGS